jgi:hypothetical protein
LTAQDRSYEDPRTVAWRRRVVATSTALLCAVSVGVAALWAEDRRVSYRGLPDWDELALWLLFASPNVLLALIGLQVASGSTGGRLAATILTGLFGTGSAAGHGLFVAAQVIGHIDEALAYYVSSFLAAALVLSLPITRWLLPRRPATIVTIVGLAVPPAVFAVATAHSPPFAPSPWDLAWLATAVPVPVAGAIVLGVLVRGAPTGPDDSV